MFGAREGGGAVSVMWSYRGGAYLVGALLHGPPGTIPLICCHCHVSPSLSLWSPDPSFTLLSPRTEAETPLAFEAREGVLSLPRIEEAPPLMFEAREGVLSSPRMGVEDPPSYL
jgi:hypothetical protein